MQQPLESVKTNSRSIIVKILATRITSACSSHEKQARDYRKGKMHGSGIMERKCSHVCSTCHDQYRFLPTKATPAGQESKDGKDAKEGKESKDGDDRAFDSWFGWSLKLPQGPLKLQARC